MDCAFPTEIVPSHKNPYVSIDAAKFSVSVTDFEKHARLTLSSIQLRPFPMPHLFCLSLPSACPVE